MNDITPQSKTWTIGGREFVQEPLGLDRIGRVFGVLSQFAVKLTEADALQELSKLDTEKTSDILQAFSMLMRYTPDLLPILYGIILDVHSEEDVRFLRKHIGLSLFMKIGTEFVKQNDIASMKADFLELWQMIQASLPKKESGKPSATLKP